MLAALRDPGFDVLARNLAEAIRTTDFAEPLAKFPRVFVSGKFGQACTHWEKLMLRVRRGVGKPVPAGVDRVARGDCGGARVAG